jgi:hypothetical protein
MRGRRFMKESNPAFLLDLPRTPVYVFFEGDGVQLFIEHCQSIVSLALLWSLADADARTRR